MRIQDSEYEFPEEEWGCVSDQAKDLIRHLLVKDPLLRYSASEVLTHPWVSMESSKAQLATPQVLQRNNSVNGLEAFAENANATHRLILRHLSISEAVEPAHLRSHMQQHQSYERSMPRFTRGSAGGRGDSESDVDHYDEHEHSNVNETGSGDNTMFFIGEMSELSEEETSNDQAPILWMGLTPPGESSLARRRRAKSSTSSTDHDDTASTPRADHYLHKLPSQQPMQQDGTGKSPPKVPSAMF